MSLEVETASPWCGCLCACSLASKKPSEQDFFIPAGTDLGVKLLSKSYHNSLILATSELRELISQLLPMHLTPFLTWVNFSVRESVSP